MNKILEFVVKRMGLSRVIYNYKFRNLPNVDHPDLSVDKALEYLYLYSPDVKSSCVCIHEWNSVDCDLEIIVPCYNAELYVEECIDSILFQKTDFSYFVTIVNDGSLDRTKDILRKYEGVRNVKIINQENMGISGARNTGISQAHGRYLMFVDSDDVLIQGALQNLMLLAYKTSADIVDSGHVRFADPVTAHGIIGKMKCFLYDLTVRPYTFGYSENAKSVSGFPCGKIIKASIFKNIQFPLGYWYEDTVMWMVVEHFCKRKATTDFLSFRYRMNPYSISHLSKSKEKAIDSVYVTLQLFKDREQLGIKMNQSDYDSLVYQIRANARRLLELPVNIQYAAFVIHRYWICNIFDSWKSSIKELNIFVDLITANNFEGYQLWCRWH